jgi:hypothetical protein
LRRTKEHHIILHAYDRDRGDHRSFRVDRLRGVQVTSTPFTPRYIVEFIQTGTISAPPTQRKSTTSSLGFSKVSRAPRRSRASRQRTPSYGPTYILECTRCGKHFRRKSNTTTLNPHKDKNGWPCPGRTGYLVDTQY